MTFQPCSLSLHLCYPIYFCLSPLECWRKDKAGERLASRWANLHGVALNFLSSPGFGTASLTSLIGCRSLTTPKNLETQGSFRRRNVTIPLTYMAASTRFLYPLPLGKSTWEITYLHSKQLESVFFRNDLQLRELEKLSSTVKITLTRGS